MAIETRITTKWSRTPYEVTRPATGRKVHMLRCGVCKEDFTVTVKSVADVHRNLRRFRLAQLGMALAVLLGIVSLVLWSDQMGAARSIVLFPICLLVVALIISSMMGALAIRHGAKMKRPRRKHDLVVQPDA